MGQQNGAFNCPRGPTQILGRLSGLVPDSTWELH
jgi:hypothetical protein